MSWSAGAASRWSFTQFRRAPSRFPSCACVHIRVPGDEHEDVRGECLWAVYRKRRLVAARVRVVAHYELWGLCAAHARDDEVGNGAHDMSRAEKEWRAHGGGAGGSETCGRAHRQARRARRNRVCCRLRKNRHHRDATASNNLSVLPLAAFWHPRPLASSHGVESRLRGPVRRTWRRRVYGGDRLIRSWGSRCVLYILGVFLRVAQPLS